MTPHIPEELQPPTRPETVTSIAGERVGASRIG